MPYINVDEAYILDNTGLQVDQVVDSPYADAGFTDTQKEQFRKNIAAGGTNPNLLDNWYFVGGGSQLGDGVFPINQRGLTSYGASTKAFDRWITESGSSVTLSSNGVTFSGTTVSLFNGAAAAYLVGKTVTISAQLGDGTIISGTGVVNPLSQDTMIQAWLPTDGYVAFAIFSGSGSYQFCRIYCGSATVIRAVKLELGTVSTLANDPPPDFGEEFEKCRYYLRYIPLTRYAIAIDGANAYMTMIGMPMRGVPTPSLVTAGGVRDAGGTSTITSATVTGFANKIATVQFALSASRSYVVGYIYDTVLCLSAEL